MWKIILCGLNSDKIIFNQTKTKRKKMKIANHEFDFPIIQAGMGIGITLSKMAIASAQNGVVPVVALVGTQYYIDNNIPNAKQFNSRESIFKILSDIREVVGNAKVYCNIMYALVDFEEIVKNAIEAGYDGIICGAGFQDILPELIEKYKKPEQEVVMIPIVNHRALPLLLRTWKKRNKKEILPDAVILEGPQSGGHQGYKIEEIDDPNFQLEVTAPKVLEQISKTATKIPLFVAGGIMYQEDIQKFLDMGCAGVQMGTRFLMTYESDAHPDHKIKIIDAKKEDIVIGPSPAGYPCRKIKTILQKNIENKTAPKVICKSNCLSNCNNGEVAKELGFCIANELGRGYQGDPNGLYFAGARAYQLNEIISVKELVEELTNGLKY